MQWIEVSVPTRSDEIDDVCAQLAELGAGGMVVEDETDFQQFLEQNHQYWDYVDDALEAQFRGVSRIKFYLADDDDGRAQLAAIRAGIGRELTTTTVRDSDWENNWRQYYQPIETGERLVVVPEWLDAPADGRLPLRLNPGLIFGTGSHATTRMCLAALEHCAGADRTVESGSPNTSASSQSRSARAALFSLRILLLASVASKASRCGVVSFRFLRRSGAWVMPLRYLGRSVRIHSPNRLPISVFTNAPNGLRSS